MGVLVQCLDSTAYSYTHPQPLRPCLGVVLPFEVIVAADVNDAVAGETRYTHAAPEHAGVLYNLPGGVDVLQVGLSVVQALLRFL